MFKNIKNELYYQYKSEIILGLLIFILSCSILTSGIQIYTIKSSYDGIVRINKEIALENKDEALKENISISTYYNEKYKIDIKNHLGTYISSFGKDLLIIAICVYAITVSLYDFEKKTIKYKLINIGYLKTNISKLISITIITAISVTFALLTYIIITEILKYGINFKEMNLNKIGFNEKLIENAIELNILYQLLYIYGYTTFFTYIAYFISQLLFNKTASYICIIIYFLAIPQFSVWDIKNQMVNILFNIVKGSKESFVMSKIIIDNNLTSHIMITTISLVLLMILFMILNKRRFYNKQNRV